MARTKKTTTAESAPIVYSGEVTIKIVNKKGKVKKVTKHNSGTIALFTFLTKALKGDIAPKYRPTQLMAFNDNTEALSNKITYNGTPQLYNGNTKVKGSDASTNGSNAVQFTFQLPFSIFVSQKFNKLKLYNSFGDSGDICAEVDTGDIELDVGENALIYWKMTFLNANQTNGGN